MSTAQKLKECHASCERLKMLCGSIVQKKGWLNKSSCDRNQSEFWTQSVCLYAVCVAGQMCVPVALWN